MLRSTLHQQETRPPNRTKSSWESGQRLGTNKFHSQSLGTTKSAREIDQNVAEKHGWKWAATSFINENWGATKEDLCLESTAT